MKKIHQINYLLLKPDILNWSILSQTNKMSNSVDYDKTEATIIFTLMNHDEMLRFK